VIFVHAPALGWTGTESPTEINSQNHVLGACEQIRVAAARHLGYRDGLPEAFRVALVTLPRNYVTTSGQRVESSDIDICSRIISLGKAHHAHTLTGAICLAVASQIPGTIPAQAGRNGPWNASTTVRIGHAAGVIEIGVALDHSGAVPHVETVTTFRTARRLMDGYVYVPADIGREFV
jgi:2-methylaconitate isomerase